MPGERRTRNARRAPSSAPEDVSGRLADQIGDLSRAVALRALPPEFVFEVERDGQGRATIWIRDTRRGTRAMLIAATEWGA